MIAARRTGASFVTMERPIGDKHSSPIVCSTTGEVWQFLRLRGTVAELDRTRLYLDNLPGILGVLAAITAPAQEGPQ